MKRALGNCKLEQQLNIEKESFRWQNIASCRNMDRELFFDGYEDEVIANQVDEICFSCPVQRPCGIFGERSKSTGVWGGVYLLEGVPLEKLNEHKTEEDWDILREVLKQ